MCPTPLPPSPEDGREVEAKRAIPREETSVAAPSSPSTSTPQTKKVFLGGLSLDTTEDEIKEVLETMGKVSRTLSFFKSMIQTIILNGIYNNYDR